MTWFDGFGARTFHKLHQLYGMDGSKALHAPASVFGRMGHPADVVSRFLDFRRTTDPSALAEKLKRECIEFLLRTEDGYPPLLQQIADPPFALFVRGPLTAHCSLPVAVVGTRACTPYGRTVATSLSRDLAVAGCAVISGMALGIDAVAHHAALDVGGACVAVLGTGCDEASLYPRANVGLAHRILESGGAVISEFPPGTGSNKHHFPLRNRIISGLARAVIVVEADMESGSLITARQALEQNREVFAVPGPVTSRQSSGTNHLLRLGAAPCTGAEDILDALKAPTTPRARIGDLSEDERSLLTHLDEPRSADELARLAGRGIAEISPSLTSLELKGAITPQGGGVYVRSIK